EQRAILVNLRWVEPSQRREDGLLKLDSRCDLLCSDRALLLRAGEVCECLLVAASRAALGGRMERQPEGALDRAAPVPVVLVVEDLADRSLTELTEGLDDGRDVLGRQLVALVAERLLHLLKEARGVDELHLAAPLLGLLVGEHPDVSRDAGVEEELVGQRN